MDKNIQKIKPSGIFTNYIYKAIPLAFDESMSYYETLCGILSLLKTQEEVVNNNADLLAELELYVQNYFKNLDVQTEINNKLDEMAKDGTLENLISQYIQLQTTYIYNTVAEMKQTTNLIDGSFARTSGFYKYNDGGGAYYKIRTLSNTDTIDNIHLFTLDNTDNLVAELIANDFNILKFGAKSGEDITNILDYIMTIVSDGDVIYLPKGDFYINKPLIVDKIISIIGTSISQ